jgi:hypothetical protein
VDLHLWPNSSSVSCPFCSKIHFNCEQKSKKPLWWTVYHDIFWASGSTYYFSVTTINSFASFSVLKNLVLGCWSWYWMILYHKYFRKEECMEVQRFFLVPFCITLIHFTALALDLVEMDIALCMWMWGQNILMGLWSLFLASKIFWDIHIIGGRGNSSCVIYIFTLDSGQWSM